ncbi:hypothetical protein HNY73_016497 [Argiope bruennichi]|uniref:Uncharacterized protein n=1 Tax=Argiope bruennichi TaxID=94029 RepID=A0A8T0EMH3_ARGBR|nr:hypothetical protein HNY73_016497 [Argiope bruennichi]
MKTIQLTGSPKFVYQEPRRIPTYMAAIIRRQRFIIIAIICIVILIMYSWRFQRTENFVLNSTPVPYIKETFNEEIRNFDSNEPHFSDTTKITNNIEEEQTQLTNFQKLSKYDEISPFSPKMDEVESNIYKADEFTPFIPMEEMEKFTMKDIGEIDDKFLFPIIDEEAYTEPVKPHLENEISSQSKNNTVGDTKYVYLEETSLTIPHNDKLVSLSAIQQPQEGFPPPDLDNEWVKTEHVTFSMLSNITDIIDISINKHIPLNKQMYSATESNNASTSENHVLLIDTPGLFMGIQSWSTINNSQNLSLDWIRYYNITPEELICYYQPINRVHAIEGIFREVFYILGDGVKLEFGIPMKEDFVNVSCNIKGSKYEQYITLVPLKEAVEEERNSLIPPNPTLNVILIGIDSVSKLNFLRHFPKTHAFLSEKLTPFEMNGYTKVADNTFPNIVPLLTGQFVEHWWNETLMDTMYFDNVSFIWKEYAKRGYRTFFAEDSPHIGIFNFFKRGFYNPPTDYYFRPMALALEMWKSTLKQTNYFCLDSQLEFDFIFDYLKLFAKTMGTRPYFGFTMVSAITHDDLNYAGWADEPTVRLLEGLLNTGALNNTLLVLFSDHGLRFGNICRTYVGKFEERLPLMYIHAPKWFLDQYPEIAKNLQINQNRLMTLFDVHATMVHMLDLGKCQEDRSKVTLGKNNAEVINATQAIVDDINSKLQPYDGKCEILEVDTISDARVGKANERVLKYWKMENDVINRTLWMVEGVPSIDDYMITLITKPGGGVFEGTVRHNPYDNSYNVLGVNRISLYGNTSWCIDSLKMKIFCYCKMQLT